MAVCDNSAFYYSRFRWIFLLLGFKNQTYSTEDSHVVTHRSTDLAIRSLTMGERTGSRVLFNLWPYV
ncbi:hypothetical protein BJ508DRAFT_338304, partial [Ascobolus immersus RN42]